MPCMMYTAVGIIIITKMFTKTVKNCAAHSLTKKKDVACVNGTMPIGNARKIIHAF